MTENNSLVLGKLLLKVLRKGGGQDLMGTVSNERVNFYSCNEYWDLVNILANGLKHLGMEMQDKVAILGGTSLEWHLFDMSIISSRAITVPIYPTYLAEEIGFIFNHSECSIIVIDSSEQLEKIIKIQKKLPRLKAIISLKEVSDSLKSKIKPGLTFFTYAEFKQLGLNSYKDNKGWLEERINSQLGQDIVSIIYTSGTTGEPKGTVITNHAFSIMLENVKSTFQGKFSHDDCSLTFLPLAHVLGRCDSMMFLVLGYRIVYAESVDVLVSNLATVRPTIMFAVPRIFEKIYAKVMEQVESGSFVKRKLFAWAEEVTNIYYEKIESEQAPTMQEIFNHKLAYKLVLSKIYNKFGGRVRYFISGGAPLSVKIIKFMRNANLTILEGYGLTETIAPCCVNPTWKQVAGSVGIPMGDVQIGFAEDGEILIKTEAMFSEYYKSKESTAEVIKEGWFYSGDIGELTTDGYLKITDRKKDIIITSGGKNIAPQKIENIAKTQKYISHLMVIGDKRKHLTAIVGIEIDRFRLVFDSLGISKDIKDVTVSELATNVKVQELIQNDINSVNQKLAKFETIKKFVISPEEFSIEGGHLTPSLKLRKKIILAKFAEKVREMYQEELAD